MVLCVSAGGRPARPRIVARLVSSVASAVVIAAGGVAFAQTPPGAQAPPGGQGPPAGQAQPAAPAAPASEQDLRDELQRLRQEFEAIRDSYGARLAALEARLGAMTGEQPGTPAQAAAAPAQAPPPTPAPPAQPTVPAQPGVPSQAPAPAGATAEAGGQGSLPVYGNTSSLSKVFNPDIAVIGNFVGAAGTNDVDPAPAFDMHEAEATFQAIVDPYARADFFLSVSPEGVELEEGFLTLTSLPGGLLAKVGKFKEQVGKVNTLHPHALPWADTPLVMRNLLGGEEGLSDAGVSVSKLILNPLLFLEATGEVYRGESGIFSGTRRRDVSWVGRLRGYRDLGESTNLDIGGSLAYGASGQPDNVPDANAAAAAAGSPFHTRLVAVDATFRYRPLQRAIYRRFMGRTELFWSRQGAPGGDVSAFGMYASGDYQFARRWFAGARYDWSERGYDASLTDKGPSLVLTYWPSEFSQVRGQYRRLRYAEGSVSNELLFQFLFSIGAHGAHVF